MNTKPNRRPIKTRGRQWAGSLARWVDRQGLTPNGISRIGIAVSLLGGALMIGEGSVGLLLAAGCVQVRLLCNMLDGLVAVECGRKGPLGDLYNEVPDRIEDVLLLTAAGFASGFPWLGGLAALLAVGTAYLRLLGGSLGFDQDFRGPLAKPQRMFVLTVSLLFAAGEQVVAGSRISLSVGLALIVAGTVVTLGRRLRRLARNLEARQ